MHTYLIMVSTSGQRRWVVPLGIALLTALAFLPALGNGFVNWDDDKNFLANPDYRGLAPANLRWMWTTFLLGHYVPLSWMSLGLDYLVWRMNPAGYHLTNIVLHSGNAVVLFFVGRRLARLAGVADPVRVTAMAAAASLFFALHPLRVESVAWVTERRDVLSGLFYSLAILAYLKSCQSERNVESKVRAEGVAPSSDGGGTAGQSAVIASRKWYFATLGLFLAALLSKATSITLPALLLILNVYPLRRLGGSIGWRSAAAARVYASIVPFALLGLATIAMTFTALQRMPQLAIGGKIAVSSFSIVFYLWKTLLPSGLSPLYPMPASVDPLAARYVMSYALVGALAAAAWLARRRSPAATAGIVAFVVIVFPMLGFHQNGPQIAADRYTYHPAPALALLAAAALFTLLPVRRALVVAAMVILTLGALTWRQTLVWRDSRSLWSHALRIDNENAVAHSNWGNLLLERDSVDAAMAHYRKSLSIAPGFAQTHNHLGVALSRRGEFREAVERFRIATSIESDYDEPYSNWGAALAAQGDLAGAIERYRQALALNPNNAAARVNWGNALVRMNRPAEAVTHYEAALRIRPENPDAHHNWGVALARQQDYRGAIRHFEAALALDPNRADTRAFLEAARSLDRAR